MLDLMTLGASMGLQTELTKVREETGAPVHQQDDQQANQEQTQATPLTQAAEMVSNALTTVEETVAAAASTMIPSGEMVSEVMESVSLQAPTVDLSLPTQPRTAGAAKK